MPSSGPSTHRNATSITRTHGRPTSPSFGLSKVDPPHISPQQRAPALRAPPQPSPPHSRTTSPRPRASGSPAHPIANSIPGRGDRAGASCSRLGPAVALIPQPPPPIQQGSPGRGRSPTLLTSRKPQDHRPPPARASELAQAIFGCTPHIRCFVIPQR